MPTAQAIDFLVEPKKIVIDWSEHVHEREVHVNKCEVHRTLCSLILYITAFQTKL